MIKKTKGFMIRLIDVLKRFKPETKVGELIKLIENEDINIDELIDDMNK